MCSCSFFADPTRTHFVRKADDWVRISRPKIGELAHQAQGEDILAKGEIPVFYQRSVGEHSICSRGMGRAIRESPLRVGRAIRESPLLGCGQNGAVDRSGITLLIFSIRVPLQSLRASVSLRLGHTRVLTCHRHVIHYARAASLPPGDAFITRSPISPNDLTKTCVYSIMKAPYLCTERATQRRAS